MLVEVVNVVDTPVIDAVTLGVVDAHGAVAAMHERDASHQTIPQCPGDGTMFGPGIGAGVGLGARATQWQSTNFSKRALIPHWNHKRMRKHRQLTWRWELSRCRARTILRRRSC